MQNSCDICTVLSFKLLDYVSNCLNPLSPPLWFYATGFFVRRSHPCHDRLLISTATLFLAAKSEETARPLNNVLRASCEILHRLRISMWLQFQPHHIAGDLFILLANL